MLLGKVNVAIGAPIHAWRRKPVARLRARYGDLTLAPVGNGVLNGRHERRGIDGPTIIAATHAHLLAIATRVGSRGAYRVQRGNKGVRPLAHNGLVEDGSVVFVEGHPLGNHIGIDLRDVFCRIGELSHERHVTRDKLVRSLGSLNQARIGRKHLGLDNHVITDFKRILHAEHGGDRLLHDFFRIELRTVDLGLDYVAVRLGVVDDRGIFGSSLTRVELFDFLSEQVAKRRRVGRSGQILGSVMRTPHVHKPQRGIHAALRGSNHLVGIELNATLLRGDIRRKALARNRERV